MSKHIPLSATGKRYDKPPPDELGHLPEWPENRKDGLVWCMACCFLLEADGEPAGVRAKGLTCSPGKIGLR